jgi:hypothetical protein
MGLLEEGCLAVPSLARVLPLGELLPPLLEVGSLGLQKSLCGKPPSLTTLHTALRLLGQSVSLVRSVYILSSHELQMLDSRGMQGSPMGEELGLPTCSILVEHHVAFRRVVPSTILALRHHALDTVAISLDGTFAKLLVCLKLLLRMGQLVFEPLSQLAVLGSLGLLQFFQFETPMHLPLAVVQHVCQPHLQLCLQRRIVVAAAPLDQGVSRRMWLLCLCEHLVCWDIPVPLLRTMTEGRLMAVPRLGEGGHLGNIACDTDLFQNLHRRIILHQQHNN